MTPFPALPEYELIRCLGGGPLTQVFEARCADTDHRVAVKVLRDADDSTAIKLLQREARAGLSVRHTHLVRIVDAHVTCPPYFLVMELLAGESLRQRLRREFALDVRTALWVVRQTAEALAALHRKGFLHADVKPDNIRLIDTGTARLVDLGFAHRPGENDAMLQQGFVLGTANYLAPELCGCRPEDTAAADIFSLGVTLFETLTGTLPYPPGSVTQTMASHCNDEPIDLTVYGDHWPSGLSRLLRRLLARRPAERPSAAGLVRDLVSLEIDAMRWRIAHSA